MKIRSKVGFISAVIAALIGSTLSLQSVNAAGLPSIRLVSPAYGPTNSVDATGDISQYYSAGTKAYYTYIAAGTTLTLKYHVTTDGTTAAANTQISLQVDAPYSGSKANWISGSTTIKAPAATDATFGAELKGTTDANGDVVFVIQNTDTTGLENAPTSLAMDRAKITPARFYGTMKPIYPGKGDKEADVDLVTFDVAVSVPDANSSTTTTTPAPVVAKPVPSMRLVSPVYTSANSVDTTSDIAQWYTAKTKAWYTYVETGSTLTLKYKVTTDGTTPAANTEVKIQVDAPYSGSKANWSSGSTKITAPAATDATFGAELMGTTNAAGEVTFVLKNTDTSSPESAPAVANQAAKGARLFGTIKPIIPGFGDKDADVDLVTFDVYAAPAKAVAKKTTITCIKGKLVKKVSAVKPVCPKGYIKKK